ncbi:HD domain-containing protein [Helicobacter muridarum]|uniref:HD domain-containing protein n=1 Tax=Helicobacter muridarum TaxID=216 RepID=A0A099TX37_9HELI|nr:HD domain-containing protein [Helicobacter muridarum]TLE00159.1 HD domain-containing protein [Helicobacter muridarum]STQ87035.1 putative HAD superfamily hydrolase [Helicobacter muridarum]
MQHKQINLNKLLLERIFTSASIHRWNDKACPLNFVELDKQAHKIILAYILASIEQDLGSEINYNSLIQKFLFEFFERVVLTDIKPPIFHRLKNSYRQKLAKYVKDSISKEIEGYEFFNDMEDFLSYQDSSLESRILKAAHFYVSKWEFDIIYYFNPKLYDIENIKKIMDSEIEDFYDLPSMKELMLYQNLRECIGMFGELRFQKRWSQTPRIPQTSVLGHTLVVAICAYLLSIDLKLCNAMCKEHFFCGLFHDLPEILTRDIISPIKCSVLGLDELLKRIEQDEMQEKILNKLPKYIAYDISYWTTNEFKNRFIDKNHDICIINNCDEFLYKHNDNDISKRAICGDLLKFCDKLSAFLEAKISILHGVSSPTLQNGADSIYASLQHKTINGVRLGEILSPFM